MVPLSSVRAALGTSRKSCSPVESRIPEHAKINHTRPGPSRIHGLEFVPYSFIGFDHSPIHYCLSVQKG